MMNILPTYKHITELLQINQFIGYGIFSLIVAFYSKNFQRTRNPNDSVDMELMLVHEK